MQGQDSKHSKQEESNRVQPTMLIEGLKISPALGQVQKPETDGMSQWMWTEIALVVNSLLMIPMLYSTGDRVWEKSNHCDEMREEG